MTVSRASAVTTSGVAKLLGAALLCVAGSAFAQVGPSADSSTISSTNSSTSGGSAAADPMAYAGSDTCRSCHQDHYASWHRTYHRTMTQEATPQSVAGRFDGTPVTYWGQTIRPVMRDGEYRFEYLDDAGRMVGYAAIKRTVGSHRYQQYLAQAPSSGDNYIRMQLLWHIEDARWVHMNGAFLYSDDQTPNQHVSTWNSNCIFCHNTQPQPKIQNYDALLGRTLRGELINFLDEARFDSEVSELGIACEACHGPGAQHAETMRNPFKRYWHAFVDDAPVDHVVYPDKLTPERASQVCGQCHAQRVPVDTGLVRRWLTDGPTYRPGEDLLDHVTLIQPTTPGTKAKPDLYRLRFWPDGTPRLSAYEYTGLRQTACHTAKPGTHEQASCIGCHAAHGGEPEGMITEAERLGASCATCHADIEPASHTRHPAGFSGPVPASAEGTTDCVSCHMPRIVYGVMAIHRSHNIERPAPAAHAEQNRPDACTSCHLGVTAQAAQAAVDGWAGGAALTDTFTEAPEWLRQLLGGDPVQRAIAAEAAEQPGVVIADKRWLVPPLLVSLDDDYPAVRRFAAHSLRSLSAELGLGFEAALADYDFIAAKPARRAVQRKLLRQWAGQAEALTGAPAWLQDGRVEPKLRAALTQRAADNAQRIEIGE